MTTIPPAPLDPEQVALALAPFGESRLLPRDAYVSDEVLEWERRYLFDDWTCVGQGADVVTIDEYDALQGGTVEREYARLYDDYGLGTTTWSPLASGLLTGKYNDGVPPDSRAALKGYEWIGERVLEPDKLRRVRQLVPIAQELGCTMAQLALAWCLRNPRVSSVITGASRPAQVAENMKALAVVPKLTAEVIARIDAIATA